MLILWWVRALVGSSSNDLSKYGSASLGLRRCRRINPSIDWSLGFVGSIVTASLIGLRACFHFPRNVYVSDSATRHSTFSGCLAIAFKAHSGASDWFCLAMAKATSAYGLGSWGKRAMAFSASSIVSL